MHRASIHRFPYSQKIRSWQKPQVLAVGRGDLAGARYHITRWRILGKVCLFSVILSSHPTSNHFAYISTMYPNVINHRTATTTEWPRIPTNSTPLFQPILILSFLHFIIWNLYQKKAEFRWQ